MQELFILARDYLRAASDLYGMIPLGELYTIFALYHPGVRWEQFLAAVRRVYNPGEPYRLLGADDIYHKSICADMQESLIVNKRYCYATWDELFTLEQNQSGKPRRLFPEAVFLRYADHNYIPDLAQIRKLSELLSACLYSDLPLNHVLSEAVWCARQNVSCREFLKEMQRLGCRFADHKSCKSVIDCYWAVCDVVPKDIHNGNSQSELREYPIPDELKKQVYYLWFCPPKETKGTIPLELGVEEIPFTGKTMRAVHQNQCLGSRKLPPRLYEPCFCGSNLDYCDCCGKR